MKNNFFLVFFIFLLVFGAGYLYFKNQQKPTKLNIKKDQSLSQQPNEKIREIEIVAKNWEFVPAEIKVKYGEKVRFKIKSIDVDHGFALPDFNIDVFLKPGKEEKVEFIADKKGKFTFFCSVFCGKGHRDMKGTLIVE